MFQIDHRVVRQYIDEMHQASEKERLVRQFKEKMKTASCSSFKLVIKLLSFVEFRVSINIRTRPGVHS